MLHVCMYHRLMTLNDAACKFYRHLVKPAVHFSLTPIDHKNKSTQFFIFHV